MGQFFERPIYGLLAGVVTGAWVITAMTALGYPKNATEVVRVDHSEETAAAFTAAWHRKVTGTWRVELQYVRTLRDGRRIFGTAEEAQRPPMRIRSSFGSVRLETADFLLLCRSATEQAPTQSCRRDERLPAFDVRVQQEVDAVRRLVSGGDRSYNVSFEGRCFRLRSAFDPTELPWGKAARFCFDPATGAPLESTTEGRDSTDSYVASAVSAEVPSTAFDAPVPLS